MTLFERINDIRSQDSERCFTAVPSVAIDAHHPPCPISMADVERPPSPKPQHRLRPLLDLLRLHRSGLDQPLARELERRLAEVRAPKMAA